MGSGTEDPIPERGSGLDGRFGRDLASGRIRFDVCTLALVGWCDVRRSALVETSFLEYNPMSSCALRTHSALGYEAVIHGQSARSHPVEVD